MEGGGCGGLGKGRHWSTSTKLELGEICSGVLLHSKVTIVNNNVYFKIVKRWLQMFSAQRNDKYRGDGYVSLMWSFHNIHIYQNITPTNIFNYLPI